MPLVKIDADKCKGCGLCISACPQAIIRLSSDINQQGFRYAEVFEKPQCIGCSLCAVTCPDLAVECYVDGVVYHYYRYGSRERDV